MPSYPQPVGVQNGLPPFWTAIMQTLAALQTAQNQSTALPTLYSDQFGNHTQIVGQLNQIVTIGAVGPLTTTATTSTSSKTLTAVASTAGAQVGMVISGPGIPAATLITSVGASTLGISNFPTANASGVPISFTGPGCQVGTGLASVAGTAYQTGLVTTSISTTAGSITATVGSAAGLSNGMQIGAESASAGVVITPGTWFTISGTTLTLSQPAVATVSAIYCAACSWTSPGGPSFLLPPALLGVSPTSGSHTGGSTVLLTGTGFTGATAVKFGATNATSFTVISDTQIVAVAPAEVAGTVAVSVTNATGSSPTTIPATLGQFTFV
jgi:hypothetical protein